MGMSYQWPKEKLRFKFLIFFNPANFLSIISKFCWLISAVEEPECPILSSREFRLVNRLADLRSLRIYFEMLSARER